jgi:two-component system response regulator YesN
MESVQQGMRAKLGPILCQAVARPGAQTRAQWIIRRVLEQVDRDYGQPLMLRHCAAALNLNAAYLSSLFSRTVGRPFKTFLTELRMRRAKELLSDCRKTVSEVAYAVGYNSENRFRLAFKKMTGLAPRSWRETTPF